MLIKEVIKSLILVRVEPQCRPGWVRFPAGAAYLVILALRKRSWMKQTGGKDYMWSILISLLMIHNRSKVLGLWLGGFRCCCRN